MGKKDPRIDAYIARSADFAKPILKHIRKLVHTACPQVEETMKWSFPHFDYKGILCSMAAFKNHCTFGFWKGAMILRDTEGDDREEAMGQFGRITALADLPKDRVLTGYIKEAVRLNDEGIKLPRRHRKRQNLAIPDDLAAALKKNKNAQSTFENFSDSHKREYVEWIVEAKREVTRRNRLRTTVEWLVEGKPRNWKYAKCSPA